MAGQMPAELREFFAKNDPTLQVFCPTPELVFTSFEVYLPPRKTVGNVYTRSGPPTPELCWLRDKHEYHAYLPKKISFYGHLMAPLQHHEPTFIQLDRQWFFDEKTRRLWSSLDANLEVCLRVLYKTLWITAEYYEPPRLSEYGFTRGHKSEKRLRACLEVTRLAFVHRLAYLAHAISLRYEWGKNLVDQKWWEEITARCGAAWVDSVWEVIYKQWNERNFVGVVILPLEKYDYRWLKKALEFGVPIWVYFPSPACYAGMDGRTVEGHWLPRQDQVEASRRAEQARFNAQLAVSPVTLSPPAGRSLELPPGPSLSHSEQISPPAEIPKGAYWFKSWEEFFRNRDESDVKLLQSATLQDKQVWESRAREAKKFAPPGRKGAVVYEWQPCDSGGFLRTQKTRFEAAESWEHYHREALVFHPLSNSWDYCPSMWRPAVEDGPPDDDDLHIMEPWYTELDTPVALPEENRSPLEFLYRRYGFLTTEPTSPPTIVLPFDAPVACRMVGLDPKGTADPPEHLNLFISSILQSKRPPGHCDLFPTLPSNEQFPSSGKTVIRNTVFESSLPGLSQGLLLLFNTVSDPQLLAVHKPLCVLEMVRAGTETQLSAELQFLLHNGSRFTLLYPRTRPSAPPSFNILTFPLYGKDWTPGKKDFEVYMSRLKTFFHERPDVVVAAFSRGGIAWRIAREVLGTGGSVGALLNTLPDQSSYVGLPHGTYWFHEPNECEWFYLVGGYETLTGL